jgi:hypothetical protein
MKELPVSRLSGAGESVLTRVQEYPDLSCRRPDETAQIRRNSARRCSALDARILHVAGAIKRPLVVRVCGGHAWRDERIAQ